MMENTEAAVPGGPGREYAPARPCFNAMTADQAAVLGAGEDRAAQRGAADEKVQSRAAIRSAPGVMGAGTAETSGDTSRFLRETDAIERFLAQAREEIQRLFDAAVAAQAHADAIQKRLEHEIDQRQRAEAALADTERHYKQRLAALSAPEQVTAPIWSPLSCPEVSCPEAQQ